MKAYFGYVTDDNEFKAYVTDVMDESDDYTVLKRKLRLSALGKKKSPDGYNWGYIGSGPAAMAHSIISDLLGSKVADECFMEFLHKVVAGFPVSKENKCNWIISEITIRKFCAPIIERKVSQ